MLSRIRDNQLENSIDAPIKTSEDVFAETPEELAEGIIFQTSGSTGEPKRVPYKNPEDAASTMGTLFRLTGLENEVALNLGAPRPHPTSWVFDAGMERVGGRTVNQNFTDYATVLEEGSPEEVTALITAPNPGIAIGQEIATEYGSPAELFPNLETIVAGGDLVTAARREKLCDVWGADAVREAYGTTECITLASDIDGTRKLVPHLHRFIIEIIPDDNPDEILDIREVSEPTRGSILITDPRREAVDLTRYKIGDKIEVTPTDDLPRITVLGREDNSLNLSGALLYPADIHDAVSETFGPDADWVIKAIEEEFPAVEFYIVGGDGDEDAFLDSLFERNGAVKEAYHDVGAIEALNVRAVDTFEDVLRVVSDQRMKSQQMVFGEA